MDKRYRLREAERQLSLVIEEQGDAPPSADLKALRHRLRRLHEGFPE